MELLVYINQDLQTTLTNCSSWQCNLLSLFLQEENEEELQGNQHWLLQKLHLGHSVKVDEW